MFTNFINFYFILINIQGKPKNVSTMYYRGKKLFMNYLHTPLGDFECLKYFMSIKLHFVGKLDD